MSLISGQEKMIYKRSVSKKNKDQDKTRYTAGFMSRFWQNYIKYIKLICWDKASFPNNAAVN
jgi:hypothetical protein